ncbi:uncharacterized protein I303_103061 [Kwoniella dejecticola CBS 10117]|uniref:Uncharacterized protein n=1 Tax=Kwoniella dejecticola CBS 10117 TaxID=1296121 RepID=A0A1A6AAG6_9TREE|nr:uncharacterized protein I303_03081 [Kwoniella dejecticola CBS 10117]OBR87058.1 hypothetical protein I303_03081 [Kwoniella dejecticola CBS 10117]
MPFHLPSLMSKHDDKKDRRESQNAEDKPAFIPTGTNNGSGDSRRKSLQLERTISLSSNNINTNNNNSVLDGGLRTGSPKPLSPSPTPTPSTRDASTTTTTTHRPGQKHRSSSSTSGLQSILKNPTSPSISGSEYTTTSGSGSAFLAGRGDGNASGIHKRMSSLAFDRTDTIESINTLDDDIDDFESTSNGGRSGTGTNSNPSTPATSVSSFNNQHCPLPNNGTTTKFPFFMMTLSSVSTLSFIALPIPMRTIVIEAINGAWKRGISKIQEVDYQPELMRKHREKGCDSGVWEVTMKGEAWMPTSSEQVSSKRILLRLMTEFAREGYDLSSSFRTSAKDSGKDALIFLLDEPDPDPIFFAVAFYSHDRIWIIDAEADVGQALEEGIKNWWVDGLRDARVRERHCRELRLRGAPWTAHSTQSLISARCIHLTIMKLITHCDTGYDFVGSVDMADKEEGEMPVTFYRKKRDNDYTGGHGHRWKMVDSEGNGLGLETVIS